MNTDQDATVMQVAREAYVHEDGDTVTVRAAGPNVAAAAARMALQADAVQFVTIRHGLATYRRTSVPATGEALVAEVDRPTRRSLEVLRHGPAEGMRETSSWAGYRDAERMLAAGLVEVAGTDDRGRPLYRLTTRGIMAATPDLSDVAETLGLEVDLDEPIPAVVVPLHDGRDIVVTDVEPDPGARFVVGVYPVGAWGDGTEASEYLPASTVEDVARIVAEHGGSPDVRREGPAVTAFKVDAVNRWHQDFMKAVREVRVDYARSLANLAHSTYPEQAAAHDWSMPGEDTATVHMADDADGLAMCATGEADPVLTDDVAQVTCDTCRDAL